MRSLLLIKQFCLFCLVAGLANTVMAQEVSPVDEQIAVKARPSRDSVTLRWAPLNFSVWQQAILRGYTVERYVVGFNDSVVTNPVRSLLASSVKPLPEEKWESLVKQNKYGAIAAQALYGDRFEIDLGESDVFTIVNKVQENEQRFYFALFAADMSAPVARASALWFTDTTVVEGEKYLYRISVNGVDSLRGSTFVASLQPSPLPPPQNPQIEFNERLVSLKWDRALLTPYTAYRVERSLDGITFNNIYESAIATVSPDALRDSRYEYATDSVPDLGKTYYYRIIGLTPFGEEGPPSAVISGQAKPVVEQVPYIISAESRNNSTIQITWDFPEANNNAIQGFIMERAANPATDFQILTRDLLHPTTRLYEDKHPEQSNYYRIKALGHDNAWYSSHVFYCQLIDSLPPSMPQGLEAKVSDEGIVRVSWTPNTEKDIYGYRVYKSNYANEEVAQMTIDPIPSPIFIDSVDLNVLNEQVYYRVMAIDANQNHSSLSPLLKLSLPDKVKPQCPVFLPVISDDRGIVLSWLPGGSLDIVKYKVYRKTGDEDWLLLETITSVISDSLLTYIDTKASVGQINHYTVISVDDADLESNPAIPVSGVLSTSTLRPPVQWKKPRLLDDNELNLSWTYDGNAVDSFTIFRSEKTAPYILHRTIADPEREFREQVIPGHVYRYRIMATFQDGTTSHLSDELVFSY